MFFAKPGEYPACGMFSITHIIVLIICIILIGIFSYLSRNIGIKKVNIITKVIAILLVMLESGKIIFSYFFENKNITSYLPLHFCSMFIYACLLSGFAKGFFKKTGEAFIGSGAIIAGACFLVMPTTSVTIFPMFHFLPCYSMLFHSLMVYLGITYLTNGVVKYNKSNLIKYSIFCTFFALIAYIINLIYKSNLMFLKEPYNIPIPYLDVISKKAPPLYSLIIYLACTYGTYLIIYLIVKVIRVISKKPKLS